eukprot:TRINITY_DN1435_c0_g1_i2.p1 TRINITY_DN1435_c0_g1~~TRINITY_DN1435_c0_g1_i2.p1  ORF type:complete len:235 (-),score=50.99 TRINITY_DN1435_c0_g1_i2:531-1235(-)
MESVAVQQQQAQCLPQIDFSAFLADPSRMNALHSRTQELLDARRRQTKQTVFGPIVDEPPVGALAVVNPFTTIPAAPVEDMHMLLMDADCVPDITLDCALAYCARGYCALNGLFSLLAKQNQVDTVEQIESHVNALRGMLEGMVINFPRGLPPPRVLCAPPMMAAQFRAPTALPGAKTQASSKGLNSVFVVQNSHSMVTAVALVHCPPSLLCPHKTAAALRAPQTARCGCAVTT